MSSTNENSVLFALNELRELEASRIRTERDAIAKREREEREKKERAEAEKREADAHALRVAEAEARARVEAEERARNADSERRLATLRAELDAVQQDRVRMHERIAALPLEAAAESRDGASRVWAFAFAAVTVLSLGLGGLLFREVNRPAPVPQIVVHEVQVPAPVVAPPPSPVAVETTPAEPAAEPTPPAAPTRPHRPHRPPTTTMTTTMELEPQGCDPDVDPICGAQFDD